MIYLKSVLVGIAAAMTASVIYIVAMFVIPLLLPFLLARMTGSVGGGAAGAVVSEGPLVGIALAAFAAGFYWQLRRASKTRRSA